MHPFPDPAARQARLRRDAEIHRLAIQSQPRRRPRFPRRFRADPGNDAA